MQVVVKEGECFLSPNFFKQKQVSRFQFANHSVDPIKSCDLEEIQVPMKI